MISRTRRRVIARSGSTRPPTSIGEDTTGTDPGVLPGCPTWPEEFACSYREAGYWTGGTFGSMLRDHGERTAVVDGDPHITYGELDVRADRWATVLRKRGNRKPQSTAARRAGQGRGEAVALASIAPYRVPQTSELPANRVDWTPDSGHAVLLIHDMERHFVDAFPPGEEPLTEVVPNIRALGDRAREVGVPVVHCAQPGGQTPEQRGLQLEWWGTGVIGPAQESIIDELAPEPGDGTMTVSR